MQHIVPVLILFILFACQEGKTSSDTSIEKQPQPNESLTIKEQSDDTTHDANEDSSLIKIDRDNDDDKFNGVSKIENQPIQAEEAPQPIALEREDSITKSQEIPSDTATIDGSNTKDVDSVTPNKSDEHPPVSSKLHDTWDVLLQKYVDSEGNVDYAGLMDQKSMLQAYLNELAKEIPGARWPQEKALAYWINAYNAFTVRLILDHYPVASIQDIYGGNPWDRKWIELAGKKYSLNQIEHDIIRPNFGDARIHFAVNCAARSCPPLLNAAFEASTLDKTLDRLTRAFINDTRYNNVTTHNLALSRIFDWYRTDFGDLISYVDSYTEKKISANAEISFRDYDWSLNGN